ncbi:MAG: glycosyltransferase family 2 protein [Planctomycetota bacterium]|nr:glycosyltransferase family 2 protein [Planctomycetota bacterium]
MVVLSTILIVLTGGVLVVWASRHLMIIRQRKHGFVLKEDYQADKGTGNFFDGERASCREEAGMSFAASSQQEAKKVASPLISVVVAAKDEQDNIEQCIRTMLEQDYPNFEMIVANDRSDDATAEIVERIAAEDSRLRLINIEHLPDGWCGKNNAMQNAIAAANGDWICMIDADCRQTSKRTLSVTIAYAGQTGADLLSILPNLEMQTFWENVAQPVCSGIMMIWFNPDKVNDPDKPHAYANGAFMLMKRSAYEQIGTHQAVRDKVNEDMHMASLIKSAGLNLRVVRNNGLSLVRMYTSLGETLRGWSRIFYGTFGTLKRLGISLTVLAVMGLLPYAALIIGLAAVSAGSEPARLFLTLSLLGAAAAAMQISVIWRFCPMVGAKSKLALTYPLGCVVGIIALVSAMTKLRRGSQITWRNTAYKK